MAQRIKPRGDTAENWTAINPILGVREYGFETDTLKHKYGNGVDHWNDLDYASSGSGSESPGFLIPLLASGGGTITYNP